MWKQYRKTLIPTQLLILIICGVLLGSGRATGEFAVTVFLVMQVGALLGAWWGNWLKDRLQADHDRLPLERR